MINAKVQSIIEQTDSSIENLKNSELLGLFRNEDNV